jgi:hypothetical protein
MELIYIQNGRFIQNDRNLIKRAANFFLQNKI